MLAGGVALLLSEWTLRVLYAAGLKLAPYPWTLALSLTPDWRVFAYTFLLALAGGAFFGFVPALQASSLRIASALHEDATILGLRVSRSRVRNGLVIAQISCSLVLLIAAALLTRGLQHARALDLGFTASNVLYAEYDLEKAGYSKERAAQFTQQLSERAGRIAGVEVTGLTSHVPLHGGVKRTDVQLADARRRAPGRDHRAVHDRFAAVFRGSAAFRSSPDAISTATTCLVGHQPPSSARGSRADSGRREIRLAAHCDCRRRRHP